MRATQQDGSYPRPMMCRDRWTSLDGTWDFAYDDEDVGLRAAAGSADDRAPSTGRIEVPFPPESPASGIGDTGVPPGGLVPPQPSARRAAAGGARRSARAACTSAPSTTRPTCGVDGQHVVATHVGGQTPFTADVTDALRPGRRRARARRACRGRPRRRRPAARQAGLARAAARHLVRAHDRHLADGVGRDGARRPSRRRTCRGAPTRRGRRARRGRAVAGAVAGAARLRGDARASASEVLAEHVDDRRRTRSTVDVTPRRAAQRAGPRAGCCGRRSSPTLLDAERACCATASRRRYLTRSTATSACARSASAAARSCSTARPTTCARCSTRATGPRPTSPRRGTDELRGEVELIKAHGLQRGPRAPEGRGPAVPLLGRPAGPAGLGRDRRSAYAFSHRGRRAARPREWLDAGAARPEPPVRRRLGAAQRELGGPGHRREPGAAALRRGAGQPDPGARPDPAGRLQRGLGARRQRHPRGPRLQRATPTSSARATATTARLRGGVRRARRRTDGASSSARRRRAAFAAGEAPADAHRVRWRLAGGARTTTSWG